MLKSMVMDYAGEVLVSANFCGKRDLSAHVLDFVERDFIVAGIRANYSSRLRSLSIRATNFEKKAESVKDIPEAYNAILAEAESLRKEHAAWTEAREQEVAEYLRGDDVFKPSLRDSKFMKAWNKANGNDEAKEQALIAWARSYGMHIESTTFLVSLEDAVDCKNSNRNGLSALLECLNDSETPFTKDRSGYAVWQVMMSCYADELWGLGYIDPVIPTSLSRLADYVEAKKAAKKAAREAKKAERAKKYAGKNKKSSK